MKPSVSVIIPAYNVEAYLGAAIDSVLAQTRRDIEIVIVDDGSTDRTVEVAERYQDPRIRVFKNERNAGASQSRNVAIGHARGEWVAILDSDDWWAETRLERLLTLAEAHGADIVGDDIQLVKMGELDAQATFFQVHAHRLGVIDKPFELSALRMVVDDYGVLKPIFRKSFLEEKGLRYNPAFKTGEDFDFLLRALLASARMVVSNEALYYYRARGGSLVADPVKCLAGILEMADALLRTVDGRTHAEVVRALEGFRAWKHDEWENARFRVPIRHGHLLQCLALARENPAQLPRYARLTAERVVLLVLLPVLSCIRFLQSGRRQRRALPAPGTSGSAPAS
ncbi:glycosyltransferase family 2 protein [Corallococcus sp. CA047B]|uniref:glycosyltransferase family 2 protein n=1 Tax=Corallococcus sp. CA047B TaxID=2316729 RepID=UPI000EA3409E|nr:glycosyltransferase family 2 protein [Corallococcus sp. CA047B]RKH08470.1 glycosyltransferase family 2 protein [Corallococcus sp. CA047B]